MRTNYARPRPIFELVVAVAMGLSLSFVDQLHGFVAEAGADQDGRQASDRLEKAADGRGVCERDGEKLVGQTPVRTGGSVRPPKKVRDVPPKYPADAPGTTGRGMWLGEVLLNKAGKIAHIWPIREVQFVPPLPAFNSAITDAIRQWEFEPLLVEGKKAPVCMTVTVTINWQ